MLGAVELRKMSLSCVLQLTVCICMLHNYFVNLSSEQFFNATIAFLDLENVENDILHATF